MCLTAVGTVVSAGDERCHSRTLSSPCDAGASPSWSVRVPQALQAASLRDYATASERPIKTFFQRGPGRAAAIVVEGPSIGARSSPPSDRPTGHTGQLEAAASAISCVRVWAETGPMILAEIRPFLSITAVLGMACTGRIPLNLSSCCASGSKMCG